MAYKSTVINSNKELSKREEIKFCEVGDSVSLDTIIPSGGSVEIDVDTFVFVHIENDKAASKEYDVCLFTDTEGTKYKTGSESFMTAINELYLRLKEADELEAGFKIKAYKKPSKNFSGEFITCTLA